MALSSKEITSYIAQAEEAFKNKEYNQAVAILNSIIHKNPDCALAYRALGSVLMYSPSQDKALKYLNKAIELEPNDADNWSALGYFYKRQKTWSEALKAFNKSLNCQQENRHLLEEVLQLYRLLDNHKSAIAVVKELRIIDPGSTLYLWNYAQLLKEAGEELEALEQYALLVQNGMDNVDIKAIEQRFFLMIKHNLTAEAYEWVKALSNSNPKNATLKHIYYLSCNQVNKHEEALLALKDAFKLTPDSDFINSSLGAMYLQLGDTDNSSKYFENALKINPLNIDTLRYIGDSHKYSYDDVNFKRLNFAASHIYELTHTEQISLHYALGKAYDDVGELETAFEHFKLGGALHSTGKHNGELSILQSIVTKIKNISNKDFFEHSAELGYQSKKPIFIMGMPRSGSTLIEQVLTSINGVYGAGELTYATDALDHINACGFKLSFKNNQSMHSMGQADRGKYYLELTEALVPEGTDRIIDKMPDNFIWLGLLHLILPNASFIHSRRHPVETCLSAYRLVFPLGHYWSGDLQAMGKYYRLYSELTEYWKSLLPSGKILEVRYEDMVSDLEVESKRLAEYIGMQWSPSCMKFHENKRAVRTASFSQVRQPLYKTSINRWRKYEPYLKPLLDEIGDLVEAYEAELQ